MVIFFLHLVGEAQASLVPETTYTWYRHHEKQICRYTPSISLLGISIIEKESSDIDTINKTKR